MIWETHILLNPILATMLWRLLILHRTTLHQVYSGVDSSKDQGVQTNSSTHASDHLGDYDLASMTTLKVDKDKLQAIKQKLSDILGPDCCSAL